MPRPTADETISQKQLDLRIEAENAALQQQLTELRLEMLRMEGRLYLVVFASAGAALFLSLLLRGVGT